MRVLELYRSFDPRKGGVERHIFDIGNYLVGRGHKVYVTCWNPLWSGTPHVNFQVCRLHFLNRLEGQHPILGRLVFVYVLAFSLLLSIVRHRIRVIHAHDYLPALAATFARGLLKLLSIRVISTFHLPVQRTSWIPRKSRLRFLEPAESRFFIKSVERIICVSKYTFAETLKLGFPRSKVCVIYNWASLGDKSNGSNPAQVIRSLGIHGDYILACSRLRERQKGLVTLLEAFELIRGKGIDIDLVLVGSGPDKSLVISKARDLGVYDRMHLLSRIPDRELAALYFGCRIFVVTSKYEGLPTALLDALAFGKPIVTTGVGGIPEAVIDGYNGIVVNPVSDDVARAIIQVVGNPNLARRLGNNARSTYLALFSVANLRQIENALEPEPGKTSASGLGHNY